MDSHTSTTGTPSGKAFKLLTGLLLMALLGAGAYLWKERTALSLKLAEQADMIADMERQLSAAKAEIANFNSGDSTRARETRDDRPVAQTEVSLEEETLPLQSPSVATDTKGLTVTLVFGSETSELPDRVALVVRIPGSSAARITGFSPVDPEAFSEITANAVSGGKLAVFQGRPRDISDLCFHLNVSAPVTATVRGSEGIRDFEIDIRPGEPVVKPL